MKNPSATKNPLLRARRASVVNPLCAFCAFSRPPLSSLFSLLPHVLILALATTGCQVMTYQAPTGERFTRSSLGSTTSLTSLSLVTETNGLRRVELRGYKNDGSQALGAVTEAAVRAAIQTLK